jgi:hypothetical protein
MMRGSKESIGNQSWLSDPAKSGATCAIETRQFASWKDTGKGVGTTKTVTEPLQGSVNDCFFIAALASVAHAAAAKLKTHPNYQFYNTVTKVWDPSFTTNSVLAVDTANNLVYARSGSAYIWPCLYEKAYAKWLDPGHSDTPSIGTLLNGGNGLTALQNICGGTLKTGAFVFNAQNKTTYPSVAKTKSGAGAGLTSNHTYSVLKKTATGYKLRNPCGGALSDITTADFNANFIEWGYVIPG